MAEEGEGMVPGRPAHRRVLITGVTGLVGQALLERILVDHPRTDVVLTVRRRHESASRRVQRLLAKPCFRAWRDEVGAEEATRAARERISVIECDLRQEVPSLPADLSAVIHCAGDVAFHRPADESLGSNLLGSLNLLDAVRGGGGRPHFVHVSTAYVAGFRNGLIPEAPLDHDVDWRAELASAVAVRQAAEPASRSPVLQARFLREARRREQLAGSQAVTALAEQLRRNWVEDRLASYGRSRAQVLGWPDSYTFSKAMGERALAEAASSASAPLPLSIVRPSIIASALSRPYPGWSDSFKMSGPLVVAFGQGIFTQVRMLPDTVMDMIPVDLVVSGLLAIAASPPAAGSPVYYHLGSGARNPLTGRELASHLTGYFYRHPLSGTEGAGPVAIPAWRFVPPHRADLSLQAAGWVVGAARQALMRLPPGQRTGNWLDTVGRQEDRLAIMRQLTELYAPYLEMHATFCDRRTIALHKSLPPGEQRRAGFDVAEIDWARYLQEVHFPSVTAPLRALGQRGGRTMRRRGGHELPEAQDVAAVFDLEGTLLASNVVEAYLWTRLLGCPPSSWGGELAVLLASAPRYASLARRGRAGFLQEFARRYRGIDDAEFRRVASQRLGDLVLERAWPAGVRRVRKHRAAGHRTVLITGAIDVFLAPLAPLFDEIAASRLEVVDGRVTGFLRAPPLVGDARAAWLRRWCDDSGIDRARSYAYADHYSDRAFLEAVGNPVAVNPDPRLYRHAREAHWPIERWRDHAVGAFGALAQAAAADAGQPGEDAL
jgi:alcohol-forming fatty acyl-CoA reductase